MARKLTDERDAASSCDSSTDDGQTADCRPAAAAAADTAKAPPTQTRQQESKTQQTDAEKEEKKRQQEEAYREISVEDVWLKAEETVCVDPPSLDEQQTQRRDGWHTVRIFVSSTFRDFHTERDLLVKKVVRD